MTKQQKKIIEVNFELKQVFDRRQQSSNSILIGEQRKGAIKHSPTNYSVKFIV